MQSANVVPQPSSPYFQHWENFFHKFGCIACGRTDAAHIGSGFCQNCRERIVSQLTQVIEEAR